MGNKLSLKLIAAVGAVVTLITGCFAYVMLNAYQRQLIAHLESYAHQLSETVRRSTRYDMLLNRRESLHQIINTIGMQEGIDKVRIFNKEGVIILSTDTLDVGQMVDQRAEACYVCHAADQPLESVPVSDRTRLFEGPGGTRVFGIINPIYNEPSCWQSDCHAHAADQKVLGVLDITLPLGDLDRDIRAGRVRVLLFTVLAIAAISLLIYWFAGRIVLQPVAEVVEATHHVATGDLAYTVPVRRNDEIGELAESFNEMTRKLAEAQRQLFQADKLASVGRLAAGVAHEINNPLTGVLTYSSFLLSRADTQSEYRQDLEVIVRETKRCRDIVKGLLDFARQTAPSRRRINLNEAVRQATHMVQNQLALQHVRFDLALDDTLPEVYADVNQIEQVLVNLFVNAGDAMAEQGGTIRVETSRSPEGVLGEGAEDAVRLVVRDTGCGIAPEVIDKVFDPFFTTKGQKGNGLGLAIVWGIVEEHGGRVLLDSEVGVGTTFTIYLPVEARARTELIAGGAS